MKKIFTFFIAVMMVFATATAQYGPTKFTDNVTVEIKGGVTTPMSDFYGGVSPVVGFQVDKYITPWLGFGVDANTLIANPYGSNNPHTVFDLVNVNGLFKFNVRNMWNYDGTRKFFEPVVFTGLGWGHRTCSEFDNKNYMVFKSGVEMNFTLDKQKAWAVRVTPAVVWGPASDFKLNKHNGGFELTAGIVYRFKNKDGNRHYTKIRVYDQAEVDMLNTLLGETRNRCTELARENRKLRHVTNKLVQDLENEKGKVRVDTVYVNLDTHEYFKVGSADVVSKASIRNLANSLDNTKHYVIVGYASEEGSKTFNDELSRHRAETVYNLLIKFGFPAENLEFKGDGPTTKFSTEDREANRVVVVEQK